MQHKINFMFGPEKAGKSRLLRQCIAHMIYERPFYGSDSCISPKRTLYLAGEEQPNDLTHSLMASVRAIGEKPDKVDWGERFTVVQAAGMRLDKNEVRQWIKAEIMQGGYDCLMIDPLRRVHAASESSNDEMAHLSNAIRDWSNTLGLTVLVIHHTGKLNEDTDLDRIANWSRGASDIASVLDWATLVTRSEQQVSVRRDERAAPRRILEFKDRGEGKKWVLERGKA